MFLIKTTIADDQDAVDRMGAGPIEDGGDGPVLVVEPHGDGRVLPRVLEHVAAVGRKNKIGADPRRGISEASGLVARRRGEEEDPLHTRPR